MRNNLLNEGNEYKTMLNFLEQSESKLLLQLANHD